MFCCPSRVPFMPAADILSEKYGSGRPASPLNRRHAAAIQKRRQGAFFFLFFGVCFPLPVYFASVYFWRRPFLLFRLFRLLWRHFLFQIPSGGFLRLPVYLIFPGPEKSDNGKSGQKRLSAFEIKKTAACGGRGRNGFTINSNMTRDYGGL